MYVVAEIRASNRYPELGKTYSRESWDDAIAVAVELASQQSDIDVSKEEIESELKETARYAHESGEWAVCIGQLE